MKKTAQPGATDNLGYAQRIREGFSFRSSEARCLSFIVRQGTNMLIRHILLVGLAVATASCRPSLPVTTRVNQIAPKVLEVVVRCSEPDQYVVCIEDTGSPYGYSVFPRRLHVKDPSATIVFVSDTGSIASFIVTSGGQSTFFELPTRSKDSSEKLWDSVSWSTIPVSIPADPDSRTVALSVEWKNLATGATRELKAVVKKGEPSATDNPDDAQRLREDH